MVNGFPSIRRLLRRSGTTHQPLKIDVVVIRCVSPPPSPHAPEPIMGVTPPPRGIGVSPAGREIQLEIAVECVTGTGNGIISLTPRIRDADG